MNFSFNPITTNNTIVSWLSSDAYQPAPHCLDWCQGQINNLFRYFNTEQQTLLYVIGLILIIGFLLNTFSSSFNEKYQEKIMMVYVWINDFAAMMTIALLVWFLWF